MKRIVNFLFVITLVTAGVIGVMSMDNYYADVKLNNKTIVNLDARKGEEEISIEEFLEKLIDFSQKYDVNISRYAYINGTSINIYSTNRFQEWKISDNENKDNFVYVTNQFNDNNKEGTRFLFPFSVYKLKVYDISMVNNVGLGTVLYMNTTDPTIIDRFEEEFKRYGIDEILTGKAEIKGIIDEFLLTGILCLVLSIFLCSLACVIVGYKDIAIMHAWGYSDGKVCFFLLKRKLYICLLTFVISAVAMTVTGFTITGSDCIINYLIVLSVSFTGILGILGILIYMEIKILSVCENRNIDKRRKLAGVLPGGVIVLKVMVLALLLVTITKAFDFMTAFKEKSASFGSWERTKNIYKIQYSLLDNSLEELMSDYEEDRALNDRLQNFYNVLSQKKNCFLIKADNFAQIVLNNGEIIYENEYYGDDFYEFPLGKWITIDENYLKINPINTCDGTELKDNIIHDTNVMNILVPEMYREYENIIVEKALEGFYFKKVTVDNIYNEKLNLPMNETAKEELLVNVIYVENNQNYYTYQINRGDMYNMVMDPLVYIYIGNVDSSDMGSMINTCVFYISESEDRTFLELQDVIDEAGTPDITGVKSVYDEGGAQITALNLRAERHTINAVIFLVFFFIIFIMYSWLTYKINAYNSAIKKVMGYSVIRIYKGSIMVNILLQLGTAMIIYYKYNERNLILIIAAVVILLDSVFFNLVTGSMGDKEIKNVIKGKKL